MYEHLIVIILMMWFSNYCSYFLVGPWLFLHENCRCKRGYFTHRFTYGRLTHSYFAWLCKHDYFSNATWSLLSYMVIWPIICLHGTLAIIYTWIRHDHLFILMGIVSLSILYFYLDFYKSLYFMSGLLLLSFLFFLLWWITLFYVWTITIISLL